MGTQAVYHIGILFILLLPLFIAFGILSTLYLNGACTSLKWSPWWYRIHLLQRSTDGHVEDEWKPSIAHIALLVVWWIMGISIWPVLAVVFVVHGLMRLLMTCCGLINDPEEEEPRRLAGETREVTSV